MKNQTTFRVLLPLGLTVFGVSGCASAQPVVFQGENASFRVGSQVAVANPPAFGIGIHGDPYRPWSDAPKANDWLTWGNFEPVDVRLKGTATAGGANFLEAKQGQGNWGLGFYDSFRGDFWKGATLHVFRLENGKFRLVRTAKVLNAQTGGPAAPNRLTLENGAPIQEGDEWLLETRKTDISTANVRQFAARSPFNLWEFQGQNKGKGTVSLDDSAFAPEGGSTTSLRVQFNAAAAVGQNWYGGQKGWVQLSPNAKYVFRGWAKGDLPSLNIKAGRFAAKQITPSAGWTPFEIEFTAPGAPLEGQNGRPPAIQRLEFEAGGAGTLWLDNLQVFEKGKTAPFAVFPEHARRLAELKPSFVRVWPMQTNTAWATSLEGALRPPLAAPNRLIEQRVEPATGLNLHGQLQMCLDAGANPWIIVSTQYTPAEYATLMEFLGGPESTPGGKMRAQSGRVAPWTSAFSKILIEPGNETWNGMFAPQNFAGRPETYGAWAQMIFDGMSASPHFSDEKFDFVLNGWIADTGPRGFGARALANAPSSDYVGFAPYLGGWDVGGQLADDATQNGFDWLMTHRHLQEDALALGAKTARELSQNRAKPVAPVLYESGPGYSLPGPGKPVDWNEERRGKSLGVALSYAEQLLLNTLRGYGPQLFFHYGEGEYWRSHTHDWRPHATWQAMALLNGALGDALRVETLETPRADLPATTLVREIENRDGTKTRRERKLKAQPNVPLVQLYAFQKGGKTHLALLSLRAQGTTPVKIALPMAVNGTAKIQSLVGESAMASNIEAQNVNIVTSQRAVSGRELSLDLPPHTLQVIELP